VVRSQTRLTRSHIAFPVAALALICARASAQAPERLDIAKVHRAVESTATTITAEYFDPRVGASTGAALRARLASGRYDAAATPRELATALTRDLYELTHDKHLAVTVPPAPAVQPPRPSGSAPASAADATAREVAGRRANFGVRKVEILTGNIGLLDTTSFFRLDEAKDAIGSAMRLLQYADSLILDLRDNGGGSPETVALLCGYLFDTPATPLFEIVARDGQRTPYVTPDVSPRNGTRPIFVLTSSRTFSAGEGLAFLLQEMGRAVVIGEQTPGAANPGRPYPVDEGLEVTVPNGQVRSARTGRNWEGSGVTPDIVVPAADALTIARERAQSRTAR
jgi:hypothetical protein